MQQLPSPFFAGRAAELSQLAAAFEEAAGGATRLVLVSGDAGSGKTRLLREFRARLPDRAIVLAGGCTDQAESGLPYAPVTAAIRRLVRERGVAAVVALTGTASAGDLAWLLPEFGAPRSLPDATIVRSRLFEVVRLLVQKLAAERPMVWIFEDMHWADAGTRDMLRFLAANLDELPVVLLATYREHSAQGDALLRPLLAELRRMPFSRALRLAPLGKPDVAQQLRGILGHEPAPLLLARIFSRGEGVPLFTEALAGMHGEPHAGIPVSLTDLLLDAVRALAPKTRRLLEAAAPGGNRIGTRLLAAVAGQTEAAVTQALAPALAGNVLQATDEGYAFRHALIREAVEAAMPATTRRGIHRSYALALQADPTLAGDAWLAVALARHWHLAGENARALAAAWQGAGEAAASWSYREQLEMLDLVLRLWPLVPEAAGITGASHLDALEHAADAACWAAEPERGLAYAEPALASAREAGDLDLVARLLLQRAPMRQQLAVPGQMDDLDEALRLSHGKPVLRIESLGQTCRALLLRDRNENAQSLVQELAALASQVEDEAGQLDARILAAILGSRCGEDTSAALEEVRAVCSRRRSGWLEALALNALAESHVAMGRFESAGHAADLAARRCAEVGQSGYLGAASAQMRARILQFTGRWDEAIQVLEQALDAGPPPFGQAQLALCRGEIALLRGDMETASRAQALLALLPAGLLARPLARRCLELQMRLAEGALQDAAALAADAAGAVGAAAADLRANPQEAWPFVALAVRVLVDAAQAGPALEQLMQAARGLPRGGPVEHAFADMAEAEYGRLQDGGRAAPWKQVAKAWQALGQPHLQAYALMRSAAVEADRAIAASALAEALPLALRIGAAPLAQQIAAVAGRRRVDLELAGKPAAGGTPFSLTARETQVLKLLADGKTNRQIAGDLVISVKTASVHVTNILSKLQVSTRGAAAAVAHRLGLA